MCLAKLEVCVIRFFCVRIQPQICFYLHPRATIQNFKYVLTKNNSEIWRQEDIRNFNRVYCLRLLWNVSNSLDHYNINLFSCLRHLIIFAGFEIHNKIIYLYNDIRLFSFDFIDFIIFYFSMMFSLL